MVKRQALYLLLLSAALLVVLSLCLRFAQFKPAADIATMQQAVQLAVTAQTELAGRLPGPEYSLITTTLGSKTAKQLSLHPDFAAVCVDLLRQAGVKPGDRVAVNLSGSFPGLNIAVLAAIHSLGCEPVIVSSVGASTWGATNPQDTWLDMEQSLIQARIWSWRSLAASPGGVGDRGGGLSQEGLALIEAAMLRNHIPALGSTGVADGVQRRLALYRDANANLPAALVNVGGSHVIFGSSGHAALLRQGLTTGYPARVPADSLAAPFLAANRPVIHFINVQRLAAKYKITPDSPPAASQVFTQRSLSPGLRALAAASLAYVLFVLWRKGREGFWQHPRQKSTGT